MLIGCGVSSFSWPGVPDTIGPTLERVALGVEEAGAHSLWVMDHFFQIPVFGQLDEPMLESTTALSFVAGRTRRLQVGALVTGVAYRHPGVLVKAVTTMDVLSQGRAWLGIGAAWNELEARGLGIPFPPLRERFERLEETLRIAHQMWAGDTSPFAGRHYQLEQPLNVPGPIRTPHPPILIGGSGERRTLRLVAQYADACNLFEFGGLDALRHKLDVLRRHCDDVGRDYDELVKTTFGEVKDTPVGQLGERFAALAELGVDLAIVELPGTGEDAFARIAELVAAVAPMGRPAPAVLGAPVRG